MAKRITIYLDDSAVEKLDKIIQDLNVLPGANANRSSVCSSAIHLLCEKFFHEGGVSLFKDD